MLFVIIAYFKIKSKIIILIQFKHINIVTPFDMSRITSGKLVSASVSNVITELTSESVSCNIFKKYFQKHEGTFKKRELFYDY